MKNIISPIIVGIFLVVMGIFNMKGNISTIRIHHRHRVTEEDILPFGRLVGLGTIIIGACIIVFGLTRLSKIVFFTVFGTVLLVVGTVIGLILMLWAMFKYNKGIF